MCTIPPPPPPMLPEISSPIKTVNVTEGISPSIDPSICKWATEHPELWESCVKNNICVDKPPYKYKYKWFESILQIGPTCGLVALSMLVNGEATPDELLSIAKLQGFTSNGEMFSCKQMAKLAEKAHSLAEIDNVRCLLKQGGLFSTDTVERLLNGAILLVPYDADCNHSPCLRNGHTAHWALVCGIIIVENTGIELDPKNIYVLCKHGKSKYLALWNLSDLAKSNNNLWEFSPKKGADGLVYILPIGGIGGDDGLRDQFLVFDQF
ncbi:actin maturation protease [Anticarsia gemmatalis]|uniref:actin maturation protease n=1 Tax=Anticarsia gemmatalis TaxID=129554 RepID=UPI003F775536